MVSLSLRIRLAATPIEIGSSPAKGSSYMISSGSSAMARASAMRRAMPPDTWADAQRCGAAQAHRVELHQHDVAHHAFGQIAVLAQREGDVVEHRQVGEQRAELEQHAQAPAQPVELLAIAGVDPLAVEDHLALRRRVDPGDQAQQRGLAAARAAEDGRDLAAREAQRHVVEDRAGGVIAEADVVDLDQGVGVQAITSPPFTGGAGPFLSAGSGPLPSRRQFAVDCVMGCHAPHDNTQPHGSPASEPSRRAQ